MFPGIGDVVMNQTTQPDERFIGPRDMAMLPALALVGFAARCALRVRPLFLNLPDTSLQPFHQLLALSGEVAAGRKSAGDVRSVVRHAAGLVTDRVAELLTGTSTWQPNFWLAQWLEVPQSTGRAVLCCIAAGKAALRSEAKEFKPALAGMPAVESVAAALDAATALATETGQSSTTPLVFRAMLHDLEALKEAVAGGGWAQETAVPVGLLGSLWPEGAPNWFRAEA
jgi:hypothetical protein